MSAIRDLYERVKAAVPAVQYVTVPSWFLRTTWQAVPVDGHHFSDAEAAEIARIFREFSLEGGVIKDEFRKAGVAMGEGLNGHAFIADPPPSLESRVEHLEALVSELYSRIERVEH